MHFDGQNAALHIGGVGNEGDVIVRDGNGTNRIHLDGGSGDILLSGADCAEEFSTLLGAEPGSVLVITDDEQLMPCSSAYDRRVAGVVSGAGSYKPGIVLGADLGDAGRGRVTAGRQPIALNGRVYCKVDTGGGPIETGDLLTTSDRPGHAMRVADQSQAFGAVLGKALRPHTSGTGLIPVLVALQ
jgi:hypothetical protein